MTCLTKQQQFCSKAQLLECSGGCGASCSYSYNHKISLSRPVWGSGCIFSQQNRTWTAFPGGFNTSCEATGARAGTLTVTFLLKLQYSPR